MRFAVKVGVVWLLPMVDVGMPGTYRKHPLGSISTFHPEIHLRRPPLRVPSSVAPILTIRSTNPLW